MPKRTHTRQEITAELLDAGRQLSNAAIMFHTALAELRGLSATEEKTIDLLLRHGPMTAGELSTASGLAPPSITGLIDRLEKKGYVKRVSDSADGRRVRVQYLEERTAEFVPLFADLVGQMQELSATFSIDELETIVRFLLEAARRQQACAARLSQQGNAPQPSRASRPKPKR